MTVVERHAPRDEVVFGECFLELPADFRFNDWRELGAELQAGAETKLWQLADWAAFALDKLAADPSWRIYSTMIDAIFASRGYARTMASVSRRVPREVRDARLSFRHHDAVASMGSAEEQQLWLGEAFRLGWSSDRLRAEMALKAGRERLPALSVRAAGDVLRRWESRAEARGVEAKVLLLTVIDLASQLEDPIAVLEAAGARMPELEAA